MKIGVQTTAQIDSATISKLQENLNTIIPDATTEEIQTKFILPKQAYDKKRKQHRSDIILNELAAQTPTDGTFDRILGMVDTDIFRPPLSFVFGEAECPGKTALISIYRLNPKFYGRKPDEDLLVERTTKEAVHELGHTFGLHHCPNPFCVMYFSNSIFETDRKQSLFCNKCTTDLSNLTSLQRRRTD
jgi:archaemetzincin